MSGKLSLRLLTLKDEKTFRECLGEDWGDFTFAHYYEENPPLPEYLEKLEGVRTGKAVPEGHVPATFLFAFVQTKNGEDRCVGRVSIRHELNDFLKKIGGHIGYAVRPSDRRKGYASEILTQSISIARQLGIKRALLTCDDDNQGSIRTIEKNGGILESILQDPALKVPKRRYWIEIQ